MSWLKNLLTSKRRSARHLAIIQKPACYYACLAVKRTGKFYSEEEKKKHASTAYEGYVAQAWLKWLINTLEMRLPPWRIKEAMDMTLKGGPTLFDPTQRMLWWPYTDATRDIRAEFNPIVDQYLVGNQELLSGHQAGDLMQHPHEELWRKSPLSLKRMKRSDVDAGEKGDVVAIVGDEGKHYDTCACNRARGNILARCHSSHCVASCVGIGGS